MVTVGLNKKPETRIQPDNPIRPDATNPLKTANPNFGLNPIRPEHMRVRIRYLHIRNRRVRVQTRNPNLNPIFLKKTLAFIYFPFSHTPLSMKVFHHSRLSHSLSRRHAEPPPRRRLRRPTTEREAPPPPFDVDDSADLRRD